MTILLVGNGFDLAHHLPTKYSDFLDFVKAFHNPDDGSYSSFFENIKHNRIDLFEEIEALITDNVLIEYFLSIYEDRCKKGKNGWVDFEKELSLVVQKLDEAKRYIAHHVSWQREHIELEPGILNFLKPIIADKKNPDKIYAYRTSHIDYYANRVLKALNGLTRLLEIYLYEYVEKIECNYRIPGLEEINTNCVLSFNYTDTYRRCYDTAEIANYCYIHGKAKESSIETCNLVLGIDEYLPIERKDSDNEFVWFKKFYQRIFKETGSEYLDWIKKVQDYNEIFKNAGPQQIDLYIYGHSLDVTDKDVLSRLILTENTNTRIFYHTRAAMASQINNLIKIIGEDNLIKLTGGKERRIRFICAQPAQGKH